MQKRSFFKTNIGIFIICFLLSFVFWSLSKLSKTYSEYIKAPIEIVDLPPNTSFVSQSEKTALIEVETSGFQWIYFNYFLKDNTIKVTLKNVKPTFSDGVYVDLFSLSEAMKRQDKKPAFMNKTKYIEPEKIKVVLKRN